MVYIEKLQGRQSRHVESRVSHCTVKQVGPAEYRINCNEEGKADKRVTLGLLGERGTAVCVDWESGAPCPANAIACAHAVAAMRCFVEAIPSEDPKAA